MFFFCTFLTVYHVSIQEGQFHSMWSKAQTLTTLQCWSSTRTAKVTLTLSRSCKAAHAIGCRCTSRGVPFGGWTHHGHSALHSRSGSPTTRTGSWLRGTWSRRIGSRTLSIDLLFNTVKSQNLKYIFISIFILVFCDWKHSHRMLINAKKSQVEFWSRRDLYYYVIMRAGLDMVITF